MPGIETVDIPCFHKPLSERQVHVMCHLCHYQSWYMCIDDSASAPMHRNAQFALTSFFDRFQYHHCGIYLTSLSYSVCLSREGLNASNLMCSTQNTGYCRVVCICCGVMTGITNHPLQRFRMVDNISLIMGTSNFIVDLLHDHCSHSCIH